MNTHHQKLKIKFLPWLVTIAFFMQMLDNSILNTALPDMAVYMHQSPIHMDIAITAYMLAVAILMPISGWLADRFGMQRIFLCAIFIFTLGSALCAMSETLFQLSASRIIQGIGGAALVPVGRLAILKAFPRTKYVKVMSFIVMPALLGPLIGPSLGGFLVEYLSWHWIFLINIPVGIACFVGSIFLMPHFFGVEKKIFDWKGFLLFDCAVLLLFMFGISTQAYPNLPKGVLVLAALSFILIYVIYAKGKKYALFDLAIFKIRTFNIGIIGICLTRLIGGSLPFIIPLFLQTGLGYSPSKSGTTLIPMALGSIFAKSMISYLLSNLGYRLFTIISMISIGVLVFCLTFIDATTPFLVILIIFALLGTSSSMLFTSTNTLAMIDIPNKLLSAANSVLSISMQLFLALGVSISAMLLQSTTTNTPTIPAFHTTYMILAIFILLSTLTFLPLNKSIGKP